MMQRKKQKGKTFPPLVWCPSQHSGGTVKIWHEQHGSMAPSCFVWVNGLGWLCWCGIFWTLLVPTEYYFPPCRSLYGHSVSIFTLCHEAQIIIRSEHDSEFLCTQMASAVNTSQSNRIALGCGETVVPHLGHAGNKLPSTV